jgi:DNA-binding transcriptional MerR regulator
MSIKFNREKMAKIDPDKPLFPIGVVADILDVPHQILRKYEEKEVIKPSRSNTNRRLYSQNDIQKIEYIHYLTSIKRVNLAGVREIFNLLDKLKEEEREKLRVDVEKEITNLSTEKRKILIEGSEEVIK